MRRILAVVGLLVLAGCNAGGGFGADSANAFAAQDACRNSVKTQLTSPATAHFHGEDRTFTGTKAHPRFEVTGQVDSQNGFGATLTTSWTCRARSDDGGKDWEGLADVG